MPSAIFKHSKNNPNGSVTVVAYTSRTKACKLRWDFSFLLHIGKDFFFFFLQKILKLQLNFHGHMHLCCFCDLKTWVAAYGRSVSTVFILFCCWWNSDSWGPIHQAEPVSLDFALCVNSNDEIYTASHCNTRLLKLRDAKVIYSRFTVSKPKYGNAVKVLGA